MVVSIEKKCITNGKDRAFPCNSESFPFDFLLKSDCLGEVSGLPVLVGGLPERPSFLLPGPFVAGEHAFMEAVTAPVSEHPPSPKRTGSLFSREPYVTVFFPAPVSCRRAERAGVLLAACRRPFRIS